jgi:hypothetical protein
LISGSEFEEFIGKENVCKNLQHALQRAGELHGSLICEG